MLLLIVETITGRYKMSDGKDILIKELLLAVEFLLEEIHKRGSTVSDIYDSGAIDTAESIAQRVKESGYTAPNYPKPNL